MAALAQSRRDLVLESVDCGDAGRDGLLPTVGEHDELGPAIGRIGPTLHIAQVLEFVHEFAHGLRGDVGHAGQIGEPAAVGLDLREDGGVRRLLREAGPDHPFDDLEAEQAVRLTQHRDRIQIV